MATLLDRLANRFGRWGVPDVTNGLILGQVATFLFTLGKPEIAEKLALVPDRVIEGQVWRLVTFVFFPPITNPIFALFAWYLLFDRYPITSSSFTNRLRSASDFAAA